MKFFKCYLTEHKNMDELIYVNIDNILSIKPYNHEAYEMYLKIPLIIYGSDDKSMDHFTIYNNLDYIKRITINE